MLGFPLAFLTLFKDPGPQGTGFLVLGWRINSTKPSLWRWQYSTVKERKTYILMWCLFFFFLSSLPHTLSTLCPSSSPLFSASHSGTLLPARRWAGKQAAVSRAHSKLVLQIIHRDAFEWYDWHVPTSRLPSTSSLQQVQPPGLGAYISVPKLRPLSWQLRRYHYTTGLSRQYSFSFFSIHKNPCSYKMYLKRRCNIQYVLGSMQAFPIFISVVIQSLK